VRPDDQIRLFDLPGCHCDSCPWWDLCGSALTEDACPELPGLRNFGGEHALHPLHPDLPLWMAAIDGPAYETVVADPVEPPLLGQFLPQLKNLKFQSRRLRGPAYAVRVRVILRENRIVSAAEVRESVGLADGQLLVALLFDRDDRLERLWAQPMVEALANAGYDVVTAPSYSTWTPRPRVEFLVNAKRSLVYFRALQDLHAPAVPRFAWNSDHDARRAARWLAANPKVTTVALDLSTYEHTRSWQHQLRGLAILDLMTGHRLRYIVNGPTAEGRCLDVFRVVSPDRVTITNNCVAAPAARLGLPPGASHSEKFAAEAAVVERAALTAESSIRVTRASPQVGNRDGRTEILS